MYEFNRRTPSKDTLTENNASDVFSESEWDAEDFEAKISSSLNDNLKDSTDSQWNDMLDTFNNESFEDTNENNGENPENDNPFSDGFDDDFGNDNGNSDGFDDDFGNDNGNGVGFDDDFGNDDNDAFDDDFGNDDNNAFDDDLGNDDNTAFDDDFSNDSDLGGNFKSNFSNDFKPDFSDEFNDDANDERGAEESSGKGLILQLLILIAAVLAGLVILINISLKMSKRKIATSSVGSEKRIEEISETEVSSEAAISSEMEVSSEAEVSSEEEASSEAEVSSEESTKHNYKQLKKGDRSENVLLMQNRLCELGYCTQDSCTGYYGDFTVKKVKLFQKAAGLKQTGTADPTTLERLFAQDAPKV